jgi:FlgN protein.
MTDDKEFDNTIKQFHDYLSTILEVYTALIPLLRWELEAVQKDDIETLDESMKTQQALLLKTRNFDKKIKGFQTKLGISAEHLSETIQMLPEKNQLSFFEILSQFGQISTEVRFYQGKCRTLLQSKLYLIDKTLSKARVQKDHITYNKDAAGVQGSLFSKTMEVKI